MKNLKTALLTTPALLTSPVALTFELYDQSRLAQLLTDHPVAVRVYPVGTGQRVTTILNAGLPSDHGLCNHVWLRLDR